MRTILDLIGGQMRRRGAHEAYVTCGLGIPSALTWAHVHPGYGEDERRVFRLCCTCHRLYDHGLIETAELLHAEDSWILGLRSVLAAWFRFLSEEIEAGYRLPQPELQHKGAAVRAGLTMKRRRTALKAAATRRRNRTVQPP